MKLLERIDELSKIGLTDEGVCRKSGSKEDQEIKRSGGPMDDGRWSHCSE